MKTRVLFLLGLYLVLSLTFSGIIGFPQDSLAGDGSVTPPISDSIPDTSIQSSSTPITPENNLELYYWDIINTLLIIGV